MANACQFIEKALSRRKVSLLPPRRHLMEDLKLSALSLTVFPNSSSVLSFAMLTCARKYPPFEVNRPDIINAAKATTCLFIEDHSSDGSSTKTYGTAFFVTKDHLLTAAHNVAKNKDSAHFEIRSSYAGCLEANNQSNTFACEVLEALPTDNYTHDIAILLAPGHGATNYMPLSNQIDDLKPNTVVDVVGYPGGISDEQMERFESSLNEPEKSLRNAKKLMPLHKLIASRGSVAEIADGLIKYNLSTVSGMSGGLIMRNGKAYG